MVSPYPQYPQSAPYGPGPLAPPPPPDAIRRATSLIFAGAALSVVYGIVDGLTVHSSNFYAYSSTQSGTTVHQANSLASGIAVGVIQCLLWLWMAWKIKSGRNWARVLSTVFFGFMSLGLLSAALSAGSHHDAIFALLVTLIEWGVGLAALIAMEVRGGVLRRRHALFDHPEVDLRDMGTVRKAVAVLALLFFVALFMPTPMSM